jgi:hypothetical protein
MLAKGGDMVRVTLGLICASLLAGCSALPEQKSERRTAAAPARTVATPRSPESRQCLARLGRTGAQYSAVPDQYLDQGCAIVGTVQLASLPSDQSSLAVSNLGPVTCEVSQAFTGWARYGVDRAARQILGSPLRSIETMGSYSCRNVAGSGRRSAHATGEAIDIAGFMLADGRRITVKDAWHGGSEREREFLRVVQQSACKRFGTVLSPDYNSAHHDHLHLEGVIAAKSYCR